jgi:hypothetical protein
MLRRFLLKIRLRLNGTPAQRPTGEWEKWREEE